MNEGESSSRCKRRGGARVTIIIIGEYEAAGTNWIHCQNNVAESAESALTATF